MTGPENPARGVRGPGVGPARGLPRLLPLTLDGQPASLARHLARHGDLRIQRTIMSELEQSGLTGRGGAAFPTARKLAAVAAAAGRPAVVVNGTEGEPASSKDKVLLASEPHLVLDGAIVAGRLAGAGEVVVAAHPTVAGIIKDAIAERRDDVDIRVVEAADGFVAGEASAVVNWLSGGAPVPTQVPPRLAQRGLHGRPTLVQNAETLAHLALIARHGARWFRELGTAAEPGSMLITVIGAVREPGVREIEIGIPVSAVLAAAGGPDRPLRALLIGGYFGTWVPWPDAAAPVVLRDRPGQRGRGTCRGPGRCAAGRRMRPRGDSPRRALSGGRVDWPVRALRVRPRGDRA